MDTDVLIIGGGYGGLATGALLSRDGFQVLLLEASGSLGGRASFEEREGFLLDYGLHDNRFAGEGPAAQVFGKLGLHLEFIELGEPLLWKEGELIPLSTTLPGILRWKRISGREKIETARLLARLLVGKAEKKYRINLEEFLRGCRSESVRELINLLSGLGITAPDLKNASAGELSAFLKSALKAKVKAGYPRGGTRRIIEALSEVIGERGQILLNSRVERVVLKKGRITQAQTRNTSYSARAVVCAFPIQQLPALFGNRDLPRDFLQYARQLVPTAGITLDIALGERISEHHGLIVTTCPLVMGQFTSNIDPSTAPPGKQLVSWYYPLYHSWMKDPKIAQREEERLKSLIREIYPEMERCREWERVMRLTMVDGFLPKPGQTPLDRPDFTFKNIENLFLAGDTTRAKGTGGDVAFNSALQVAEMVKDYLK
jgi:phytoene dehydrogenase-like protein